METKAKANKAIIGYILPTGTLILLCSLHRLLEGVPLANISYLNHCHVLFHSFAGSVLAKVVNHSQAIQALKTLTIQFRVS